MASSASRFLFSVLVRETPRTAAVGAGAEAFRLAVDKMAASRALIEMVSRCIHRKKAVNTYL
jgi:hypothetical protein